MVFVRATRKNLHSRRVPSELRALIDAMMSIPRPSRRGERGARASAVLLPLACVSALARSALASGTPAQVQLDFCDGQARAQRVGFDMGCEDPAPPDINSEQNPARSCEEIYENFPPAPDAMYYFNREGWPNGVTKEWCAMSAPGGPRMEPRSLQVPRAKLCPGLFTDQFNTRQSYDATLTGGSTRWIYQDTIDPNVFWHRTHLDQDSKDAWVAMDEAAYTSSGSDPDSAYIVNYFDTCNDRTTAATGLFSGIVVTRDGTVIAGSADCLTVARGWEARSHRSTWNAKPENKGLYNATDNLEPTVLMQGFAFDEERGVLYSSGGGHNGMDGEIYRTNLKTYLETGTFNQAETELVMRWKDHVESPVVGYNKTFMDVNPVDGNVYFLDQYREVVKLDVDVGKVVEGQFGGWTLPEEDMFDLMENYGGMQFDSEGNLLICGGTDDNVATAAFAYVVRPNGAVTNLMASQSWNTNVGPIANCVVDRRTGGIVFTDKNSKRLTLLSCD
jgi:hypothetical protein